MMSQLPRLIAIVVVTSLITTVHADLADIKSNMQAKQFDKAVAAADAYIKTKPKDADEAQYLKALALHYGKKADDAIKATDQLIAQYPKSHWRLKAIFLKARVYVDQRDFEKAEAIYAAEATRLLSAERKHELASVIVRFADALSKTPDPKDVGAPKPDYGKAYKLYTKALEMEIARDLRDQVMYKKAYVIQLANNHAQAIKDYQAYLREFDPDWTGPVGSVRRMSMQKTIEPKPAGKHRFEARYRINKSLIATNQHANARQNLEDLIALLANEKDQDTLKANATWQIVRTYQLPGCSSGGLEQGVKAARDFLKKYPSHRHSVEASWLIGEAYRHHGRLDESIASHKEFIDGKNYKLPEGDVATMNIKRLNKSAVQLKDEWEKQAVYLIGHSLYQQKKYKDAIAQWQSYVNRYPNGPHWSQSQRQMIDSEFMIALDAVSEKKYDDADKLFDDFLKAHPLDNRARQVLFIKGQIKLAAARDLEEAKGDKEKVAVAYRTAIDQFDKLVSKYPRTEEASLALYRVGLVYEEKLGDLEKALEAYKRLNFGSYATRARTRVAFMTQKQLTLNTERKYRTNEKATVRMNVRNIEKVTVKQYHLDLEAYFRKTHHTQRVESLDIGLIQADKTWELPVADYEKYKPIEQSIEIPFDDKKPGVCIVHVSDDKDLESTTLIIRSDIDMIIQSSRREVLVFALDMLNNKPAKDVELLLSDGKNVFGTGKTAADGVWRGTFDELKNINGVRVFAKRDGNIASDDVSINGLRVSSGLSPKGYLFTDRPAYRPGHRVSVKGIIRDVKDGSYVAPASEVYVASVNDSQGRVLRQQEVTLSEFGTFDMGFNLDSAVPLGRFTVHTRAKDKTKSHLVFNSYFHVTQYKLEKMKLALDFPQRVYFRGETIKAKLSAQYYWGQPVVGKPVRYHLPDGRSYLDTTNDKGELEIEFDTSGMIPGRGLSFTATIEGENVSIRDAVMLARLGFGIRVKPSADVVLSGEPFEVNVETRSPDDKPVGKELTLQVVRRQIVKPNPVLSGVPWVNMRTSTSGEVTIEEKKITTNDKTGKGSIKLTLEKGGQYTLRVAGDDRFKQTVTAQSYVKISDDDDETKLRLFADTATLQVGSKTSVRLHSRLDKQHAILTFSGEHILAHRVITLNKGFNGNDINLDIAHDHFPNFRVNVAALDGKHVRTVAKDFTVERQLRVTIKPLKDSYKPGAKGKIELTVTDQLDKPVQAELSLSLVDEALFAIYPRRSGQILSFFQSGAWRHAQFRIAGTSGFAYAGSTKAINKNLVQEQSRLAKLQREHEQLSQLVRQQRESNNNRRLGRGLASSQTDVNNFELFSRYELAYRQQGGQGEGQAQRMEPGQSTQSFSIAPNFDLNSSINRNGQRLNERRTLNAPNNDPFSSGDNDTDDYQSDGVLAIRGEIRNGESEQQTITGGTVLQYHKGRHAYFSRIYGEGTAGGVGGGFGGGGGRSGVRREVPEAGRWLPTITTDANGKASVEIDMPEKTTQWRITARGVTVNTLVGEAKANVLTRKDFFVSVKAPTSLREGDQVEVITRVHNLTDEDAEAELMLVVTSGDKRFYELRKSVKVKKNSSEEVKFDSIEVPRAQRLELKVSAAAGDHTDALVRNVEVHPWGMEYADHGGGSSTNDATVSLKLPDGRKYESTWLTVSVGPSVERAVIDLAFGSFTLPRAINGAPLILRPRRIGGYTGSELLAVVSGIEYARTVKAQPKEIENLTTRAMSLVSALVVTQNSDGGWRWQGRKNTGSSWGVSATSFWALVATKKQGIKVDDKTIARAQTYLKNAFQKVSATDNDAKAVISHALSVNNAADYAHLNRLHRQRNSLSAPALAYTALGFANLDRDEFAVELLDVLEQRVKSSNTNGRVIANWDGSKVAWLNDTVEATAVALLATVKVKPTSARAKQAAAYLLHSRGCFGFNPAKSRGVAVAALGAYYSTAKAAKDDHEITVLINGKKAHTLSSREMKRTDIFSVPANLLVDGENKITFDHNGRGEYAFAATLSGFSHDIKDPKSWDYPHVKERKFYHSNLEYRGRSISAASTSPVKNLESGQRTRVRVVMNGVNKKIYRIVEEPLPAGTTIVANSLSGRFTHHEIAEGKITMYYPPGTYIYNYSYELVGYSPGKYRVPPTVVRDAMNPGRMRIGSVDNLNVLGSDEKSPDAYKINNAERYVLGKAYFDDGLYRDAQKHLSELFADSRTYNERDVARMLLWIYTSDGYYNAQRIVEMFEVLRERYPELYIPFDRILTIAKAYHDMKEFERAWLVYRATIDASFIKDSNVSALLQDEGQLLSSIDYQENLWRQYPDTSEIASTYFALSQVLYQKAPLADKLPEERRDILRAPDAAPANGANGKHEKPTRVDMLKQAIRMLETFLALYPNNPLADDAAFSMANAYLDLKQYETVVTMSTDFSKRFTKSEFASSFQYMQALGHFWRRDYKPALAAATIVANGESKDRDFARYILGQVYHAQGQPADALPWYRKVEKRYPDAKEAINYFERKSISLKEVNLFQPGKPVVLPVKYRNIKEAAIQVYKVDLMKLYLREKNLSSITSVNLSGISPQIVLDMPLGDGKDYVDKEKKATLKLKDEGAYLVICRGDNLFTSGLVLITPLTIEVQEDAASGRVRANVINEVTKLRPAGVHVKAIGSATAGFQGGETDLRGLYIADGLRGKPTVIAREGETRYAFYRGDKWLGPQVQSRTTNQRKSGSQKKEQVEYGENLRSLNRDIQKGNWGWYDEYRRGGKGKGVQIEAAK